MTPTEAEIKRYWNNKATQLGVDPSATMKDLILRGIEIETIASRLQPQDVLLDIGCGNAFGSLKFAERAANVLATDYSEKMVEAARVAIQSSGCQNIHTDQADVMHLGSRFAPVFTAVTCIRCLINLPAEDQQYEAIAEIARVIKSGGRLFLIEGIAENFASMNRMREAVGLSPIQLDWHNRLFVKEKLERALADSLIIEERVDFGEYYFLSRIVNPLVAAPGEPSFADRINDIARAVWQSMVAKGRFADISTLMLYICRMPSKVS